VMVFDARCVQLIEVVDADLYVRLACFQDVVDHDQQAVGHGDRGLVASSTSRDAVELCIKVRGALLDARLGDLAHDPPQPDVAAVHRAFHPLASALLSARAEPSP
jgi:hypothetical protein